VTRKATINTNEAIGLYQNGTGAQTIAKIYGSTKTTILNTLRENGITIRGPHDTHGTHRMKGTRLYRIWHSMRSRCKYDYPSCRNYEGRGITVCDEWQNSFEKFRDWSFANGYDETLSIDRKDNNGNYEPNNCRWSTSIEQANNTSCNHPITINGVTKNMSQWAKEYGINVQTIHRRIVSGRSGEELLSKTRLRRRSDIEHLPKTD
jgi:hypothetical protein